jgi:hypothetical protein
MALEQIQGKAGSLTPDELDRLALQYKPSWETDLAVITPVVAVAAVPQANGAHANGNGAASHSQTEVADKPKFAASAPAGAPRAASIKATVIGTGSLADAPPVVDEAPPPAPPAPPIEAAAVEAPQASAPVETPIAEGAEKVAISPAAAALEQSAEHLTEDTASKEIAETALDAAATPAAAADGAAVLETTAAVVAEQAEAVHENPEDKAQAVPVVHTIVDNASRAVANDVANAEPLDAIPMQSSSSGTIMKVVFALVAIVGLAFVGKGMFGGSDKDKPKPTTNSHAAAAPTETATAKPDEPSAAPTETSKAVEAPKSVKTDAPKPADAPKGETKTAEAPKPETPKAETPKVEIPKVETPKPVVTTTAVTKATVAIAPKPPPAPAPAPTPKPTTTATAKTGGGIIRETPF